MGFMTLSDINNVEFGVPEWKTVEYTEIQFGVDVQLLVSYLLNNYLIDNLTHNVL